MRSNDATVVALGMLVPLCLLTTACTSEAPLEENEPAATVVLPTDPPPPLVIEPGISDAVIPGDPEWPIESWSRLPVGTPAPTLDNLLGKVVVILCFQHW